MRGPEPAPYEGYEVLAKWRTPSFDDRTREILAARLHDRPQRRFFAAEAFAVLAAVVARLAPSLPGLDPSLVALWIDDSLYRNLGEGFRTEAEPPLQENWRRGLRALDEETRARLGAAFADLDVGVQDDVLSAIQRGQVEPSFWAGLDPSAFFNDTLLKTIAGLSYAHPAAWNDIGFGGPASPRGYVRLGFDARDPWEAKERR